MTPTKVLVIDDEAMIRWSIEQTLRMAGHEVVAAATVSEGMALFRQVSPEVVFLDVRLGDEDGFTALQQMQREPGRGAAVIVMTAFDADCSQAEAKRRGAFEYLKKPFDFGKLDVLVERAARAKSAG